MTEVYTAQTTEKFTCWKKRTILTGFNFGKIIIDQFGRRVK